MRVSTETGVAHNNSQTFYCAAWLKTEHTTAVDATPGARQADHNPMRRHLPLDRTAAWTKLSSARSLQSLERKAAALPDTTPPVRWQPDRTPAQPTWPNPPLLTAMARGLMCRCPACGETNAFAGYLTVVPQCLVCGAPLGRLRADDAPPYFTIFLVGHLLVPVMFWVERTYRPELWIHALIWIPLSLVMSLGLLRPVKGATLGLMLKLGLAKADDE